MKNKKVLYTIDRILNDYSFLIEEKFKKLGICAKEVNEKGVLINKKNNTIEKIIKKLKLNIFCKNIIKKYYEKKIKINNEYDIFLSIGGRCPTLETLKKIKESSPNIKIIKFLWDKTNINYIKEAKEKYDIIYTFEKEDAIKYNLRFRTSFFLDEEKIGWKEKNIDCYYLGALREDKRYDFIEEFYEYCKRNKLKSKLELYIKNKKIKENFKNKKILINKWRSYKENLEQVKNSKVVIELNCYNQKGLTLRSLECIGSETKLITENYEIMGYDFYCSDNIYILSSKEKIKDIPIEFFKRPYKKLSIDIQKKYSFEGFLEEVLSYE